MFEFRNRREEEIEKKPKPKTRNAAQSPVQPKKRLGPTRFLFPRGPPLSLSRRPSHSARPASPPLPLRAAQHALAQQPARTPRASPSLPAHLGPRRQHLTPAERTPRSPDPAFADRPGPPGQVRLPRLRNARPRSPAANLGKVPSRARTPRPPPPYK